MPQRNGYRSQRGRSAVARRVIMSGPAGSTNAIMSPLGYFGGMKKGGLAPSVPSLPVGARSLAGGRPPLVNHPHHQMWKAAKITWESLGIPTGFDCSYCMAGVSKLFLKAGGGPTLFGPGAGFPGCTYDAGCRFTMDPKENKWLLFASGPPWIDPSEPQVYRWVFFPDITLHSPHSIAWPMNHNYIPKLKLWYQSFYPNGPSSPTQSDVSQFLNMAKSDLEKHPIHMKNLPVGHPAATMYHLPARGARAGVATLPGRH